MIVVQPFLPFLASSFPFSLSIFGLHSAENSKLPTAIGAGMNGILHAVDTERNQTTTSPTADKDQSSTSEPSQCTRSVLHRSNNGCSAVRAHHRHRSFAIHRIPHNHSLRLLYDCSSLSGLSRRRRPVALRWRSVPLWWWPIPWPRWWVTLWWRVTWLLWIGWRPWRRITGLRWLIRRRSRVRHYGCLRSSTEAVMTILFGNLLAPFDASNAQTNSKLYSVLQFQGYKGGRRLSHLEGSTQKSLNESSLFRHVMLLYRNMTSISYLFPTQRAE